MYFVRFCGFWELKCDLKLEPVTRTVSGQRQQVKGGREPRLYPTEQAWLSSYRHKRRLAATWIHSFATRPSSLLCFLLTHPPVRTWPEWKLVCRVKLVLLAEAETHLYNKDGSKVTAGMRTRRQGVCSPARSAAWSDGFSSMESKLFLKAKHLLRSSGPPFPCMTHRLTLLAHLWSAGCFLESTVLACELAPGQLATALAVGFWGLPLHGMTRRHSESHGRCLSGHPWARWKALDTGSRFYHEKSNR